MTAPAIAFSTSVLRMDAFVAMAPAEQLRPADGREFLENAYPSLDAALTVGLEEEDETIRQSFACLRGELATLHEAAVRACLKGESVSLEYDPSHDPGGTLDLARVLTCQHLARDLQGGPHEYGFDLLADLLVTRLEEVSP